MEQCAAVLGLGRMGSAIAERLHDRGFRLVVWNRTRSRAEELAARLDAEVAGSPAGAAEKCNAVHIVVSDDEASMSVIAGPTGITSINLGGRLVYNHTTVTPRHTMLALELVERAGGTYVEAPVLGGPSAARAGRLVVLCGSKRGESVCQRLKALGETVWVGEPPAATAAKLAFNTLFLSVVAGFAEAAALVEAYGISFDEFLGRIISKTWLGSIAERYGERFRLGHPASFAARLAGKDARYAAEALQDAGLPGHLAAAVAAYYALMAGEGYGEEDYPAIVGFMASYAKKRRQKGRGAV
ncbi:NAD(P)-dependent oxidoreductase [Hyperthermus butylicus]|uniref:3-hydroxyisobutyrate dehydrogenase n=1 Tax=Hyperthermus butylicus (strain DSM 5456 / JCM 9403 / PLM1-5) TaxID=415426 RepID=A2BJA4_HYPBU|nr:NAD(P)-dependent oxidoreductase [Hyperthermus butylicus]ABM80065.1 3-hydroxyisobutyrate dehydrogenase [Hyperthermus butylicus DSM 5456]